VVISLSRDIMRKKSDDIPHSLDITRKSTQVIPEFGVLSTSKSFESVVRWPSITEGEVQNTIDSV
jgi:hypothetical protein